MIINKVTLSCTNHTPADLMDYGDMTGDGNNNFVMVRDAGIFYRDGGNWVHLQHTSPRASTFADMTGGS